MIYVQLFFAFFRIGLFSFGGGYAAMPLIQSYIVESYKWLTMSDFTDLVTISQMTPGPIALNAATFVGNKVAGISGAAVATAGCVTPSCIIVTLLAYFYIRYKNLSSVKSVLSLLRPAVVAMIAAAGLSIIIPAFFYFGRISLEAGNIQIRPIIYFAAAIFVLRKFKWDPVFVMVLCGGAELLYRLAFGVI